MKNYNTNSYISQHYNSIISEYFSDFRFYPSVLQTMKQGEKLWNMELPKINKDERIVLHIQDHFNVVDGKFTELEYIENYYKGCNLKNIVIIHWTHRASELYKGDLNLFEFSTFNFELMTFARNRKDEWYNKVFNRTNDFNFISLNGKERKHRVQVYHYLKSLNINSKLTLGLDTNSYEKAMYKDHDFDDMNNFIRLLPLYCGANVNVVNETLYEESHAIITEKTLFAILSMQIPIVIGHKGIIQDLRDLGLDMLDDVVDHSYDTLENDIRWKVAIDSNMHLLNNEFDYTSLIPRLKKNMDYLLYHYPKFITDELEKEVISRGFRSYLDFQ